MGRGLDSPRAWGVVAAAFAAMFVAFGIAYSYGAFLEEMRADFGVGRAAGATFFSLTSLLYFGLGGVSGAASDRFGPRRVLLVGAVAFGLGLVATARADSLGVALAAYGLGVGIGVACAYVPMVALVGAWFERRRTLALGVAVAGIGIGTLTIPPATAALIEAVGWRDSYLVLAAAGAGALALCALAVAPAPAGEGTVFSSLGDALRDRQYRRLYIAIALLGVPLFVPFVYLPSYAEERGVDPVLAAGLIGAIGTASVVGRLALGAVAGRLGLLRVFRGCFLAIALSFVAVVGRRRELPGAAPVRDRARRRATAASSRSRRRWWRSASASSGSARCSASSTRARASAPRSARRRRARSSTPAATRPRSPPRSPSGWRHSRSSRRAERGQSTLRPRWRGVPMSAGIDSVLQAAVDAGDVPNVVAMAADADGPIYEGAAGPRAVGESDAATPDTMFRIASMTKMVTTTAALQLLERGKLDLDAPVEQYGA